MMTTTLHEWITRREAARRLQCDPETVSRLAQRGKIAIRRIGDSWPKYRSSDIERLLREADELAQRTSVPGDAA